MASRFLPVFFPPSGRLLSSSLCSVNSISEQTLERVGDEPVEQPIALARGGLIVLGDAGHMRLGFAEGVHETSECQHLPFRLDAIHFGLEGVALALVCDRIGR